MLLKRFAPFFLAATGMILSSCGGSPSSSSSAKTGPPSALTKRAFITNQFNGQVEVLDVLKDVLSTTSSILVGVKLQSMTVIPGGALTLVYDAQDNGVTAVDNKTESSTGNRIVLAGPTEQILVSPDGKTGYAPIRATAEVEVLDITNRGISAHIGGIAGIRRLVMNKAGSKILAFSDNQDSFFVVNTADNSKTQVTGFDRPFYGVFSSDDSKAYILNCGTECGGTAPSVTVVDMGTLTAGSTIPVGGATVGLSDGSNLYVAGTPTAGHGTLDVIALGSFTRTSATSIAISDGLHWLMSFANGKLYIGARSCTQTVTGCLSIYTISGGGVVLSKPGAVSGFIGDVTAIEPINGRTVTYVIEGGNLQIYDQKTDQPQATQVNISGQVYDVKQID